MERDFHPWKLLPHSSQDTSLLDPSMFLEHEGLGVPNTPNVDVCVCSLAISIHHNWLVALVRDHITVEVGGPFFDSSLHHYRSSLMQL